MYLYFLVNEKRSNWKWTDTHEYHNQMIKYTHISYACLAHYPFQQQICVGEGNKRAMPNRPAPNTSVKTNFPPAEPPANYPANYPAKPPVASKSQYPAGTKHPVWARGLAFCQIFGHFSKYLAYFDHFLMF